MGLVVDLFILGPMVGVITREMGKFGAHSDRLQRPGAWEPRRRWAGKIPLKSHPGNWQLSIEKGRGWTILGPWDLEKEHSSGFRDSRFSREHILQGA